MPPNLQMPHIVNIPERIQSVPDIDTRMKREIEESENDEGINYNLDLIHRAIYLTFFNFKFKCRHHDRDLFRFSFSLSLLHVHCAQLLVKQFLN